MAHLAHISFHMGISSRWSLVAATCFRALHCDLLLSATPHLPVPEGPECRALKLHTVSSPSASPSLPGPFCSLQLHSCVSWCYQLLSQHSSQRNNSALLPHFLSSSQAESSSFSVLFPLTSHRISFSRLENVFMTLKREARLSPGELCWHRFGKWHLSRRLNSPHTVTWDVRWRL